MASHMMLKSLLLWNMVSTTWPTLLSRYCFNSFVFSFYLFSSYYCLGNQIYSWLKTTFSEQGSAGCHCTWCGPDWIGCLAPSSLQEDGNPILHCEGKSTIGIGKCQPLFVIFLDIFYVLKYVYQWLLRCLADRLSIKRLHLFCAWRLWKMKTRWSSAGFLKPSRWVT